MKLSWALYLQVLDETVELWNTNTSFFFCKDPCNKLLKKFFHLSFAFLGYLARGSTHRTMILWRFNCLNCMLAHPLSSRDSLEDLARYIVQMVLHCGRVWGGFFFPDREKSLKDLHVSFCHFDTTKQIKWRKLTRGRIKMAYWRMYPLWSMKWKEQRQETMTRIRISSLRIKGLKKQASGIGRKMSYQERERKEKDLQSKIERA